MKNRKYDSIEILRKRNMELNQKVSELSFESAYIRHLNSKGHEKARELISDLASIQNEWATNLAQMKAKEAELQKIIINLKSLPDDLRSHKEKKKLFHRLKTKRK